MIFKLVLVANISFSKNQVVLNERQIHLNSAPLYQTTSARHIHDEQLKFFNFLSLSLILSFII